MNRKIKDVTTKKFLSLPENFISIVKGFFEGMDNYTKDDLIAVSGDSTYFAQKSALTYQVRDVKMKLKDSSGTIISILGIESQSSIDAYMPFRTMLYDAVDYGEQINAIKDNKAKDNDLSEIKPVITIVLYWGLNNKWNKPLSILDRMNVSDCLGPYVNDYKLYVINAAFLSDDEIDKYTGDVKLLFKWLRGIQQSKEFDGIKDDERIEHTVELAECITAITNDETYLSMIDEKNDKEGKEMIVCEDGRIIKTLGDRIKDAKQEGIQEGRQEGIEEGRQEGQIMVNQLYNILLSQNKFEEAKRASEDKEYREKLLKEYMQQV